MRVNEKLKVKERATILVAARLLSDVFRPSYYPLMGFAILLMFTYLSQLPWAFKVGLLIIVYPFTHFIPMVGVYAFRQSRSHTRRQILVRHNRIVPYLLHFVSYVMLYHMLSSIQSPSFVKAIVVISLLVQICCIIITLFWNISMHSAGAGAIIGALVVYASLFHFNPVWWLCAAILVSGLVNSSRMLLRQHTLWQVLGGTLVGFLCGYVGIFVESII